MLVTSNSYQVLHVYLWWSNNYKSIILSQCAETNATIVPGILKSIPCIYSIKYLNYHLFLWLFDGNFLILIMRFDIYSCGLLFENKCSSWYHNAAVRFRCISPWLVTSKAWCTNPLSHHSLHTFIINIWNVLHITHYYLNYSFVLTNPVFLSLHY